MSLLGLKYTKPGLQAEKNQAHHKYKKNIHVAMTDCLVILYPASRQPVFAKFVCIYGTVFFFSNLKSGLSISWALHLEQVPVIQSCQPPQNFLGEICTFFG